MNNEESKSVPVRMDKDLRAKIDEASKKTGLPKQEIIRLCTAIGIEDLRKLGWNLAKMVSDAAETASVKPGIPRHLKELPKPEQSSSRSGLA